MNIRFNKIFVIKFCLYSTVILTALYIDYYDVRVLKSGYSGFSIFDFFFYEPFSFSFQLTQLGVLILIHKIFGKNTLKQMDFNIFVSIIEVVISTIIFFMISMYSHIYWGGPL